MSAFEKVIGYENIKLKLSRVCDYLKNPEKYEALGGKKIQNLMFIGEPGVGKTLMANCVIEETGLKSFFLKKDKKNVNFVKKIKSTFKEAKEYGRCIIVLDDLDRMANADRKHRNADEFIVVQSCIDEVKESGVFVIATVNNHTVLPASLTRTGRFDMTIRVPAPNVEDAKSILKYYIKDKKCAKDVDPEEIATLLQGTSCAALESILNEAGIYAVFDGRKKIEMDDIMKAFLKSDYQMDDSLNAQEGIYLLETAYHEAGHCVMQEIQNPGSVVFVTILENLNGAAGMTKLLRNMRTHYRLEEKDKEIRVALAGILATEIQFGKKDIGGTSDLFKAFKMVKSKIGNSYNYGLQNVVDKVERISDTHLHRIENLAQSEVNKYMDETRVMLKENFEFVTKVVDALMTNKVLRAKDIQAIKESISKQSGKQIA